MTPPFFHLQMLAAPPAFSLLTTAVVVAVVVVQQQRRFCCVCPSPRSRQPPASGRLQQLFFIFHSHCACVCVCVCVRTGWKNLLTYVYVCISLKERAGQTHPLLLPFLVHICVRRVFCPSSLSLCFLSLSVPARLVAS